MKRLTPFPSSIKTCRSVVTFLDVLIVTACVGIAIGLFTPAVQTVSEQENLPHEQTVIAASYSGGIDNPEMPY